MLMSVMTPTGVQRLAQLFEDEWRARIPVWEQAGRVVLYDEVGLLLDAADHHHGGQGQEGLAERVGRRLGFPVTAARDLAVALSESDVCVTCTPSREALVAAADVRPGTFIAAVGADSHGKQELDPKLVATATLVVDVLEQCAEIGELQHALAAGLITRDEVHAELADVVVGRRAGRTRADEITIFDSSGTALQDVAAAVALYDKARGAGRGTEVRLDD